MREVGRTPTKSCRNSIGFGMQKNGKLESVGVHDDLAVSIALANWASKEFKGSVMLLDDYMPGFDNWFRGERKVPSWMGV